MASVIEAPVVVVCRACRQELTEPLLQLAEMPAAEQHDDGIGFDPTIPSGHIAVDPEPIGIRWDGTPTSTLGCLVINPIDGQSLKAHPDPGRNNGCCGHDGCDGPNRLCPGCGTDVATLCDDCWTRVELRFEPDRVLLTPAAGVAPT